MNLLVHKIHSGFFSECTLYEMMFQRWPQQYFQLYSIFLSVTLPAFLLSDLEAGDIFSLLSF